MSLRVAVIGGGISGTLCALVLQSRGLIPVVFDKESQGIGGRTRAGNHPNSGVQFIRATDPRFVSVMEMMKSAGIVEEWNGRFGFLGSKGGFLSSDIVASSSIQAMAKETDLVLKGNDEGDFCGFVNNRGKTYIGNPSMDNICEKILEMSNIEVYPQTPVVSVSSTFVNQRNSWRIENDIGENPMDFDGLVVATQDPTTAADLVDQIVGAVGNSDTVDQWEATERQLKSFSSDLRNVSESKMAGCSVSAYYPLGSLSSTLPFDAASLPSSHLLQFVSRDASRLPLNTQHVINGQECELWTAIATAQYSKSLGLRKTQQNKEEEHHKILVSELSNLFSFYYDNSSSIPQPVQIHTTFWESAFMGATLNLSEDSVGLEPWCVAFAGDYLSKMTPASTSGPSSPLEAAALSGLEAGEKLALFLK